MSLAFDHAVAGLGRVCALAERDPRRAVALARRCHARWSEPATRAAAEYTLGWALLCWEQFDEARAYLSAALPLLGGMLALRCRYALLLAGLLQYADLTLEPDFAELAAQLDAAGATADAARARIYQAVLYNLAGRAPDAEALLQAVEPALAHAPPADTGRWLRVRGAAAMQRGDYREAARLLGQANAIFAGARSQLERAKCQGELAACALQAEQLELARSHYHSASRAFEHLRMPLRAAWCHQGLGALLTRTGDYSGALPQLLAALEQFQRYQHARGIALCQLELGNLYFFTGQWATALASYARSASSLGAAGAASQALTAWRNSALVYRAQGRLDDADALLAGLEAQASALESKAELAAIWMEQAGIMAARGHVRQALAGYRRARRAFLAAGQLLGAADCAIGLGELALARGRADQALKHFQRAAPDLSQHPYHRWRAESGLARCAEARGDDASALRSFQAALATVAELRARLFSEAISSSVYTQAATLHADALRLAIRQGAIDTALGIAENQRALVLRRLIRQPAATLPPAFAQRHDALRAQIANLPPGAEIDRALAEYGELLLHARHSTTPSHTLEPAAAFELGRARASLCAAYGDDWTALCYTQHGASLLLHMLTPDGLQLYEIAAGHAFQQLVDRASLPMFRYHTYRDASYRQGLSRHPWERPRALGDLLLPRELRTRLHPNHRLLIVPAGPLHRLPWAALRLGNAWLAERAIIQLTPSLSAWQLLAERPPPAGQRALIVGCNEFGARAGAILASEEAALIGARWPGAYDSLIDAQATRTTLLDRAARGALRQYQLIHFATHAQLLPHRGLAAHIKLWDDDLLLPEVAALGLDGALVVLATCDGAAPDALPGEEVLSLNGALLAAGARAVIASVWPISNQAALGLTAALYSELREHSDAARALALAQRALLAGAGDGEAGTPIGWGGFVAIGS